MNYKDNTDRTILKDNLRKLNKHQLKQFYGILVHAWASRRAFISNQNFYNLWCELNYSCAITDDSFPSPHDDYELQRSFCRVHPYYFIDVLPLEHIINLFCHYIDNRLDLLIVIARKLTTHDLRGAYECYNKALGLTENIEVLIYETEEYARLHSRSYSKI